MSKVYVVTSGHYSDYHIVSVWAKREEAERVVALVTIERAWDSPPEIEEWECGKKKWIPLWKCDITKSGDIDDIRLSVPHREEVQRDHFVLNGGSEYLVMYVRCGDKKDVVKIANERRTTLIASDIWDLTMRELAKKAKESSYRFQTADVSDPR